jgi:hypothetical protein
MAGRDWTLTFLELDRRASRCSDYFVGRERGDSKRSYLRINAKKRKSAGGTGGQKSIRVRRSIGSKKILTPIRPAGAKSVNKFPELSEKVIPT